MVCQPRMNSSTSSRVILMSSRWFTPCPNAVDAFVSSVIVLLLARGRASLAGDQPGIDHELATGDVRAGIAGQEQPQVGDLVGLARTSKWQPAESSRIAGRKHVGLDRARMHRVHSDLGPELEGRDFGEPADAPLRRSVRGVS